MGSHIVVFRVLRMCSIKVESSTSAKVPTIVFSFDACSARGRVREEDGDTLGRGMAQECAFLRAKLDCDDCQNLCTEEVWYVRIIFSACQAGKVDQEWGFGGALESTGRQEEIELRI